MPTERYIIAIERPIGTSPKKIRELIAAQIEAQGLEVNVRHLPDVKPPAPFYARLSR